MQTTFSIPLFACLLLFQPVQSVAQGQEEKLCLYNVGLGALTSGIGAVINKKGENWKPCFFRGLWRGSLGGFINYTSKKSLHLVVSNQNFTCALPSRILNCAGNSLIQSAARNQPFLQHWSLEYTIFRFDVSLHSPGGFRVRLLPEAVVAGYLSSRKGKLDLPVTLQTGALVFKTNEWLNDVNRTSGVNYGRALIYLDKANKYQIVAHELVHEFQYRETQVANAFLQPWASTRRNAGLKRTVNRYLYPDMPYFSLLYLLEGIHRGETATRNFFEFEAERFSTNKFVAIY